MSIFKKIFGNNDDKKVSSKEISDSVKAYKEKRDWKKPKSVDELNESFIKSLLNETDEELEIKIFETTFTLINGDYLKITSLPVGFQFVGATIQLENEVYNGGFNQYFWNPSGQLANIARDGYKKFGVSKMVELIENAMAVVKDKKDIMAKYTKDRTVQAFSDSYKEELFEKSDQDFYKIIDDIFAKRAIYIRNNLSDFCK